MTDGVTFEQIRTGANHDLISLYEDPDDDSAVRDSPFKYSNVTCDYYETENFISKQKDLNGSLSYFQLNCRGLSTNWDSYRNLICDLHGESFAFYILSITEIFKCVDKDGRGSARKDFSHSLPSATS